MVDTSYEHEFQYPYDDVGKRAPRLTLRASPSLDSATALDVEAFLDSGAERSLFNGEIGTTLGIDILAGRRIVYESTLGGSLSATLHPVRLVHDDLGTFQLDVGFTSIEIRRNLLGRDFFNLIQIGFRERQLAFYITAAP